MTRFKILAREEMSARQQEVADAIASGPRGALKGPFLALIHNPPLAERLQVLGEHLRYGTGLAADLVEIPILLTARRWNCDYEWAAHARIAREAGLREHIIDALTQGHRPDPLTDDEALIHDFALATLNDGAPDEASLDAVQERFGVEVVLNVLALCGYYSLLAFVLNVARFPLPGGAQPLPPVERGLP